MRTHDGSGPTASQEAKWVERACASRKARRVLAAMTVGLLVPAALDAQVADTLSCAGGAAPVGSLGITRISCERCQFYTDDDGGHGAVFWTEPTIERLDPTKPSASVLKSGDVLVAVDGRLITTRDGSARFSSLPATGEVRLRVRRDDRERDLLVPVTPMCPTATAPAIAGRALPPTVPAPAALPAGGTVTPPATPAHPAVPAVPSTLPSLPGAFPALPALPSPSAMAPRAELGFAFSCGPCSYKSEKEGFGTWSFTDPPVVEDVDRRSADQPHGLRAGDRILKIDGVDITSPEGGRKFAAITPGDHPVWTVERDDERITVTTAARARSGSRLRTSTAVTADPTHAPLRYTGTVGNTLVEVRGGRVNVMRTDGDSLVIIRTQDAEIRIRVPKGVR